MMFVKGYLCQMVVFLEANHKPRNRLLAQFTRFFPRVIILTIYYSILG